MTRQNFYARRKQRQRRQVDGDLVAELVKKERQLQPQLGIRKLHYLFKKELKKAEVKMGRDRMFEEMRDRGLLVERRRSSFPRTTQSYHTLPTFANRIRDVSVNKPNEVWVSDLTYLRTDEGFLYLALITDKNSRKIVGYHCGDTLEAIGCVRALEMALKSLPTNARPIHHSDRGSQYCCHEYVEKLQSRGLSISMTEREHCSENALAERMNGILKMEYGLGEQLKTKTFAREVVDQAIWLYNTRRPHSAVDYRFPEEVHSHAE
jgi:transposase InsO family protein